MTDMTANNQHATGQAVTRAPQECSAGGDFMDSR
jgi:hypothetical protein